MTGPPTGIGVRDLVLLGLLVLLGGALRLAPWFERSPAGDENVYATYVAWTQQHGFLAYPDLVASYFETQGKTAEPIPPPTRLIFIAAGAAISHGTGWPPVTALRCASRAASVGLIFSVWLAVWALARSPQIAHGSALLLAVSPLQLHAARFGFVDIPFAFSVSLLGLSLGLLYRANARGAGATLAAAVPFVVLTKEAGVVALVGFGFAAFPPWRTLSPESRKVVCAGGILGSALTLLLMGIFLDGPQSVYQAASLLADKTSRSPYSLTYTSGPWFRYLLDYLLISPLTFLAAWALLPKAWVQAEGSRGVVIMAAIMTVGLTLTGVFNLRFLVAVDPWLRVALIWALHGWLGVRPMRFWLLTAILAGCDLLHFVRHFSDGAVFDPVTLALLRSLGIYRGDYLYAP